jgi:cyclopropane-fatty-acyl-phospholipid synthase
MSSPLPHNADARQAAPAADRQPAERGGQQVAAEGPARPAAPRLPTAIARSPAADRWLARRILQAAGNPPIRIVLCSGEEISGTADAPVARVIFRDRRTLWKLLLNPELYFGEEYSAGRIEVEGDLLRLLETLYRAMASRPPGLVRWAWARCLTAVQSNSPTGSRAHIHRHYDIGNDFYKLWLDEEMVYTCAYFPDPAVTLEQAQAAKMDHVCRKLRLQAGQCVVEAGCGWGALALYMARHYGVTVKAFNISHEQVFYARQRARTENLDGRVEFIEDDYRSITGRYDVFVSVGMLEHVGAAHYRDLGKVIDRCLGPAGRGLLHSIGRNQPGPLSPWIRRRIFPGAHPPTLREMMHVLEPFGFSVLDVENLRLHYAQTLRHWLARFESASAKVARMFDDRFVRMWRLYLTGSMGAFTTGEMQLFQVVFARPGVNEIPWTRAWLYR